MKSPMKHRSTSVVATALAALLAASPLSGSVAASQELTELALEDLMELEVTSASRKAQSLGETASAVYIITAREIERSSATTVPELLRRVPGLHVARLDASGWAVTSRGFNHRYASKMLVQIDGRTVYTPLFAGVYWDAQDLLLDDIERIEVIRGPGATMWGENAVNGVINIITKSAAVTSGNRVETIAGNEEASVAFRHGGSGNALDYRVYARGAQQSPVARQDGVRPMALLVIELVGIAHLPKAVGRLASRSLGVGVDGGILKPEGVKTSTHVSRGVAALSRQILGVRRIERGVSHALIGLAREQLAVQGKRAQAAFREIEAQSRRKGAKRIVGRASSRSRLGRTGPLYR